MRVEMKMPDLATTESEIRIVRWIVQGGELFTIPIASPAAKTLEEISAEIRRSVERLRSREPDIRRISPALMTVTSLGVSNVESVISIINPPEVAILGVGRARLTPVVGADGTIAAEHRLTLTLSLDHRVASGRYAGDFLEAIVKELESF
jgi:pyruvate dehydrogenase E2 component (dihydrolipoamide acetyltransferase)